VNVEEWGNPSVRVCLVFDTGPQPDIRVAVAPIGGEHVGDVLGAFGEDLEHVPLRLAHHVPHLGAELSRDCFVEQVAPGVDEDHPRFSPLER